jgi:hypothetical protein
VRQIKTFPGRQTLKGFSTTDLLSRYATGMLFWLNERILTSDSDLCEAHYIGKNLSIFLSVTSFFFHLILMRKYCLMRNQATLREVGELRLYFMPMVPDELTLKILGPKW